jgi:hypothetical protein
MRAEAGMAIGGWEERRVFPRPADGLDGADERVRLYVSMTIF